MSLLYMLAENNQNIQSSWHLGLFDFLSNFYQVVLLPQDYKRQ